MAFWLTQASKISALTCHLRGKLRTTWNRQVHSFPSSRSSSCSDQLALTQVPYLSSWDPQVFQSTAYAKSLPYRFPRCTDILPPACSKWFIHNDYPPQPRAGDHVDVNQPSHGGHTTPSSSPPPPPSSSELQTSFWAEYQDTLVSLELTSRNAAGKQDFHRVEAPLSILLSYLSNTSPASSPSATNEDLPHPSPSSSSPSNSKDHHSIYLAQCSLEDLPPALQLDLPTPSLLKSNSQSNSHSPSHSTSSPQPPRIRGDIYSSSLWLGRPPTYTPLHRDPNPNLFIQLAGSKIIRLLPPTVGDATFDLIHTQVSSSSSSSSRIRGEEMMQGPERSLLHSAIWPDHPGTLPGSESQSDSSTISFSPSLRDLPYSDILKRYGQEITVHTGEALFIPTGWWHSVKGIGAGVTASANWWFR